MNTRHRVSLFLCLCITVGKANAGVVYVGDALTKGDLAQWSVFSLLFILQAILAAFAILRMRGRTILPFALILFSALLSIIGCVSGVVLNVIENNINSIPSFQLIANLNSVLDFFSYWTDPLLFLPIVLILSNRHNAITQSSEGRIHPLSPYYTYANYSIFGVLFLIATIDGALLSVYENVAVSDTATILDLVNAANNANRANYFLTSFWYASAIYVVVLSALVLLAMRRAGAADKISKYMIYLVSPLYVLLMIDSIIFQILFSPSGIQQTIRNLHKIEQASLASEITANFFYWIIPMVLILLGLRPAMWEVLGANPPDSPLKLKTWSIQGKIVLPKLKKDDIGQNHTGFESNVHLNPGNDRNLQL